MRLKTEWTIRTLLLSIFLIGAFIMCHEQAHSSICKEWGGQPKNVYLSIPPKSYCYNINYSPEYLLAQSNVEAFGYQLVMLYAVITGMFIYMSRPKEEEK